MNKVIVVCQKQDLEQVANALNASNIKIVTADIEPNLNKIYLIKEKIKEKINYYQRPRSFDPKATVHMTYR
jgi:5S rRNA maturation endonuclease (ribonuclease M5)